MYAEELAALVATLARYELRPPKVVEHLADAAVRRANAQPSDLRFLHCCVLAGSFRVLDVGVGAGVFGALDARVEQEVQSMPAHDLLEALRQIPRLEFSWTPYEDYLLAEIEARPWTFDELPDPFAALPLLKVNGLLDSKVVESLIRWSYRAVQLPATRSHKRPTDADMVELHDLATEHQLDTASLLVDAIHKYVRNDGGRDIRPWPTPPLRYKKGRKYINRELDSRVPEPLRLPKAAAAAWPRPRVPNVGGQAGPTKYEKVYPDGTTREVLRMAAFKVRRQDTVPGKYGRHGFPRNWVHRRGTHRSNF